MFARSGPPGHAARLSLEVLGRLFLLFTVVPIIELYLLISIGQVLGAGATIGIVFATGMLGAWLAKREGGRVLREWQQAVQRGLVPKEGLTSSLLVLVGGVLLVTPGVVTDLVGLALLVPFTRRHVAKILRERVQHKLQVQTFEGTLGPGGFTTFGPGFGQGFGPQAPDGDVIDVDASESPTQDSADEPAEPSSLASASRSGSS